MSGVVPILPNEGLSEPVSHQPPVGQYGAKPAVGGTGKLMLGTLFVAGLIGTVVLVASGMTNGSLPTTAPPAPPRLENSGISPSGAPTLAPTGSPTPRSVPTISPILSPTDSPSDAPSKAPTRSSKPTRAPTTTPTFMPSKSPTKRPSRSPTTSKPTRAPKTSKPTKSPTLKPTKKPTSAPTSRPTKPTPRPTFDPVIVDNVENCTQDIALFLDTSDSVTQESQLLMRQFGKGLISQMFQYGRESEKSEQIDRDFVHFSFFTFNLRVHNPLSFEKPGSTDEQLMLDMMDAQRPTKKYTAHHSIFERVNDDFGSFHRTGQQPPGTSYRQDGEGLTLILMTDGVAKLPNKNVAKSMKKAITAHDNMRRRLPNAKILCFSPIETTSKIDNYFGQICDGFWHTKDSVLDAETMSLIVASKACQSDSGEER